MSQVRQTNLTKGEGRISASKRHADGKESVSTHLRIENKGEDRMCDPDYGSAIITSRAYVCEQNRFGSQSIFIFDPKTGGHVAVRATVFMCANGRLQIEVDTDSDMDFTLKKEGEVVS